MLNEIIIGVFPNLVASSVANLLPPNASLAAAVAASRKREHDLDDVKPDVYGKVQRGSFFHYYIFFHYHFFLYGL